MIQYVTEDEAKYMVCPQMVAALSGVAGELYRKGNNVPDVMRSIQSIGQCRASDCMFWCWKDEYGDGMGVVASNTHGYCGATR